MSINELGIIGKGKMGRDLLNYLLSFDYRVNLVCRRPADAAQLTAELDQQLLKLVKRGFLSAEGYEQKKAAVKVSADLAILKDCDLVIESVIEDQTVKQNLLQAVAQVVSRECILASNTSSIPLRTVFQACDGPERCLGIHFFYPVKLIKTVEVNLTAATSPEVRDQVKGFLLAIDKTPFELPEAANSVINKIYLALFSQIYRFYEDGHLTIAELNAFYRENLLTFGLFDIIDSAGLDIIAELFVNSMAPRYANLYNPLFQKVQTLLALGYQGGQQGEGIAAYESKFPPRLNRLEAAGLGDYQAGILLQMQSLLINEIAYRVAEQGLDQATMVACVHEVLGLYEDPFKMVERLGKETIKACLNETYRRTGDGVYEPVEGFFAT